ncbi:MAG: type II toxin-antitoxin system RelE/ParE family toxin [Burkholderiaceae bacterium]|nr:type II toxin-antitoxin system RelE/ParE family toxin [Roseateles sp.]MBV8470258.1 type II toxin-antitoxin system RelE/ParE family toxin [Burkholderiaceae bacterium]
MSVKPIRRRALADADVQDALRYYVEQDAPQAALAFIDAIEQALAHIQRHPATGSSRCAHALDLPGLRHWGCKKFPYLVFYVEHPDYIDVWRILHEQRDIPAWLQQDN